VRKQFENFTMILNNKDFAHFRQWFSELVWFVDLFDRFPNDILDKVSLRTSSTDRDPEERYFWPLKRFFFFETNTFCQTTHKVLNEEQCEVINKEDRLRFELFASKSLQENTEVDFIPSVELIKCWI
jgi:hypothetical protein